MREIPLPLPPHATHLQIERAIDAAVAAVADCDLRVTLRAELKKFPGSGHWHLKSARRPGTLELTYWPTQRRAWFTIHPRRSAPWIAQTIRSLTQSIQTHL